MGFMDGLKRLTDPYDDETDRGFPGVNEDDFKTPAEINRKRTEFEQSFAAFGGATSSVPEKEESDTEKEQQGANGGFFRNMIFNSNNSGAKKPDGNYFGTARKGTKAPDEFMIFAPANLQELKSLKDYLVNRSSVILKLDGLSEGLDRRMLDFASGMAWALDGKISPISGRTYLVAPADVKLVDQNGTIETDERFY